MQKTIGSITALVLFVGMVFGVFFWLEKRYCHAEAFLIFVQNTKYELKSNQIEKLNERTWQLEKRLETNPKDATAEEDLKKLKETKEQYKKELDELGKVK